MSRLIVGLIQLWASLILLSPVGYAFVVVWALFLQDMVFPHH